jgi:hypothetical protein
MKIKLMKIKIPKIIKIIKFIIYKDNQFSKIEMTSD